MQNLIHKNKQISVLCVNDNSNYYKIPGGIDLWNKDRDAYNFRGSNPVITHAPCQQWSRMKGFAKPNKKEKDLSFFCLEKVQKNGGVFEHPHGSSFFRMAGIKPTITVNQCNFGFPAIKKTWLYINGFETPIIPDPVFGYFFKGCANMDKSERSQMTIKFCMFLINIIDPEFDHQPLIIL